MQGNLLKCQIEYLINPDNSNPRQLDLFSLESLNYTGSTLLMFVELFTVHVRISSLKKGILSDNHRFLAQIYLNLCLHPSVLVQRLFLFFILFARLRDVFEEKGL